MKKGEVNALIQLLAKLKTASVDRTVQRKLRDKVKSLMEVSELIVKKVEEVKKEYGLTYDKTTGQLESGQDAAVKLADDKIRALLGEEVETLPILSEDDLDKLASANDLTVGESLMLDELVIVPEPEEAEPKANDKK